MVVLCHRKEHHPKARDVDLTNVPKVILATLKYTDLINTFQICHRPFPTNSTNSVYNQNYKVTGTQLERIRFVLISTPIGIESIHDYTIATYNSLVY